MNLIDFYYTKYAGQYWHVLPRDIAKIWRQSVPYGVNRSITKTGDTVFPPETETRQALQKVRSGRIKIWIDLDNTPHVPFFIPIISDLEKRGYQIVLTARDAFQVCELAEEHGMRFTRIGRHYGKNPIMKIVGLLLRSLQLLPFCMRQRPSLALSHGARSQTFLCNLLRIPTIGLADYEHARSMPTARPKWLIVPESVMGYDFPIKSNRLRLYRGFKEDVYVPMFRSDPTLLGELGLFPDETIITVRPPANEAHYYNPESDKLLEEFMSRVCQTPGTRVVLLPRNRRQEEAMRAAHRDWFHDSRTIVPPRALDGLNLLWFSDLVVSGGGTMNREAAALGIPVYSIFRGKTGAVDSALEHEGRLKMIRSIDEVWSKIQLVRRDKNLQPDKSFRPALKDIINNIEDIIWIERIG